MTEKPKPCKHYKPEKNGACKYYSAIGKPKMGLCMLPMKVTYFCHYSEVVANTYAGNAEMAIIDNLTGELK